MSLSVVTLNCNSLYARLAEVKLLLNSMKPSVMCLSETWVEDTYLPTFIGYHCLWANRTAHGGGGLCILIHQSLCALLPADTVGSLPGGELELQAVKLRLASGIYFSILNLYNPNAAITIQEFTHYTNQLNPPYVLTGDFNAHSPLLSSNCRRSDLTGQSLEQLLLITSLTQPNEVDFHTYIDRRTGRGSCLDLFILSSDVAPYFHLNRLRDVGSDHYPISASSTIPLHVLSLLPVPRWKIISESLTNFSRVVASSTLLQPTSVEDLTVDVTTRIIDAASACIPQTTGRQSGRLTSPWWDETCGEAIRNSRHAWRALERRPTQDNLIESKRCQGIARNVIVKHKRSYKREFLSKITYSYHSYWGGMEKDMFNGLL